MPANHLVLFDERGAPQSPEDLSFCGGRPRLPQGVGVPSCLLCGAQQTFFFQVSFPEGHIWSGYTLSVFSCTSCSPEGYFIPEMINGALKGARIESQFLERYQRNFRFHVFPSREGVEVKAYVERLQFVRWNLVPDEHTTNAWRIGGLPYWVYDDETPSSVNGVSALHFLLQVPLDFRFRRLKHAPGQTVRNLEWKQVVSNDGFYTLFQANQVYFFGTVPPEKGLVYCFVQK